MTENRQTSEKRQERTAGRDTITDHQGVVYYKARKAQEVLGMSRSAFFRQTAEPWFPKRTLPGMKQAVYPKRDIDALALAMSMTAEQYSLSKIVFSKSSPGDQVEEVEIGKHCFGSEFITPLPERIAFQQKSEYTFWSLKVHGKVVGYISLFHFLPEFLDDLLTGRRIEREITVKEVLPIIPGTPLHLYIDVMAMDPYLSAEMRALYAGVMITQFADVILDLLDNGYQIEKIYTVTAKQEGDRLVRHLGFQKMEGKSLAQGRVAYSYTLDEKGIHRLHELSRRGE